MWNMLKVNDKGTTTTPLVSFGVFIVDFEHISHKFPALKDIHN